MRFLERRSRDEEEKSEVISRLDDLEDRTERLERILEVEAEETIRLGDIEEAD